MLTTKLLLLALAPLLALAQDESQAPSADGGNGNGGDNAPASSTSAAPASSSAPAPAPSNATAPSTTPASGPDSLASQTVWTAFRPPPSLANGTSITYPHNGSWAVLGSPFTVRWTTTAAGLNDTNGFLELWNPAVGKFKGNDSLANAIPVGTPVQLSKSGASITLYVGDATKLTTKSSADQIEPGTGYILRLIPGNARPAVPQVLGTSASFEIKAAGQSADPEAAAPSGHPAASGKPSAGVRAAVLAPVLALAAVAAAAAVL
ncbi:uncharacterized protein LOC62_06G008078 [Vanrija pseudolonga]|uniref:Uncharacterized protein n=1 Tax=Vanrija pseudolonga TaxID=143232 RepID=A0AAF0YD57_9TREE|nr:hypothetical protein LOC62_06G008078 [Vanrija pseudolonga]